MLNRFAARAILVLAATACATALACSKEEQPVQVISKSQADPTVAAVLTASTLRLTATAVVEEVVQARESQLQTLRSGEVDPNMVNRRMSRFRSPAIRAARKAGTYVRVIRVVDGDTVDVEYPDATVERVRLLGVDAPEIHVPNMASEFVEMPSIQCVVRWGRQAHEFATDTLLGWPVALEFDSTEPRRDPTGALLAYINTGAGDFNEELLARGLARVYFPLGSGDRAERYALFEAQAQGAGLGAWSCRGV